MLDFKTITIYEYIIYSHVFNVKIRSNKVQSVSLQLDVSICLQILPILMTLENIQE